MFWGLLLKANKRYSQTVQKDFHISHATLDLTSADLGDEVVQVWVQADEANHLLCNLDKRTSHVTLDLAFSEGEVIAFYSKGQGVVHLTGFLLPEEPEFDGLGDEEVEDEEVSDDDGPTISKKAKAKKAVEQSDEDDDSELDEKELLADDDEDDELEEEEVEDEEDEDDDDEDDDEEELDAARPAKIAKIEKIAKSENGLANGKLASKAEQDKKSKKNKEEKTTPNQSQQKSPAQRRLAQGVIVEDIRTGKGPDAKPGRKVAVYYEGRLKSNNKVFDSTKEGKGFKFILGKNEVISGWDIGVVGMKVGGKRRITCPPNAAYGPKGHPPAIPANATLVFDVELRGVN